MPSTMQKALGGLGQGLYQVGLMSLQSNLQEKRATKLAEIQAAYNAQSQEAQFAQQNQLADRQEAFDREKLEMEQGNADRTFGLDERKLDLNAQVTEANARRLDAMAGFYGKKAAQVGKKKETDTSVKPTEIFKTRKEIAEALREENLPVTRQAIDRRMKAILGQETEGSSYSPEDFPGVTREAVLATAQKKGMTAQQVLDEVAKRSGATGQDIMGAYGWTPESFVTSKEPPAGSKEPPVANPKWKQGSAPPPAPAEVAPAQPPAPIASYGDSLKVRVGEAISAGNLESMPLSVLLIARNIGLPEDQKAAVEAVIAARQQRSALGSPGGPAAR